MKIPQRDIDRRTFLGLSALGAFLPDAFGASEPEVSDSEDELVELLSPDGEIVHVSKSLLKPVPDVPKNLRKGIPDRQFVMVIDLSRCGNQRKCQAACNKAHGLSDPKNWVKIYDMQNAESTSHYWQPTICMHCDEPPCVKVCPVDATFKRTDGIVGIDNDRCIGCRFCMAACPYSTRVFNWSEEHVNPGGDHEGLMHHTSQLGTVEKCDFCPHMITEGKLPHCVTACPNGVFYFGDLNEDAVTNGDETVRFSQLIKDKGGYRLMEELGTGPRVYYLPPVNRMFPFEKEAQEVNG
ncbi:4Fe-4S dicluster domain-containing protein [Marinoscillum sp. MHG1-6]|uniref:4Fe-4S dicluster domain-containing protein n=1 Tax=Marinoscillum sp. MHG1-6 TaxID=2959627 RepID=UPI0021572CDA|nr:4Fe-4S dicluster domain-containing protein [Marinoscillum sp. MHG1-6]